MSDTPAPLVGETVLGDRYEIMVVGAENAFGAASVACVYLGVGGSDRDPAEGSLTLTPDEARALAAALQCWAGHAEREGRR